MSNSREAPPNRSDSAFLWGGRLARLGSAVAACILGLSGGCGPRAAAPGAPVRPGSSSAAIRFEDVTAAAGIRFKHSHGGNGKKLMPETVGSGCVWFDYDGDGWPDLYLVNCSRLPGTPAGPPTTGKLYRNRGDGTLEDVTAASGLDVEMYGQGATAADYDGDGDPDLFITCLGANHLFRNDSSGGKARFVDVTAQSGLGDGAQPWAWHTGAAWLDYDRDGLLDVVVARYVKWSPETDQFCGIPGGQKRYCPPWKYTGDHCALYRNLGHGRFKDVSKETGVGDPAGKWFQPLVLDQNGDGWPDIAIVSDGTPTALFRNQGGKRFVDVAAETGLGVSETGVPKGQMGVDAASWRNDGRESVLIGNFSGERLSLYDPDPSGLFVDNAGRLGMGESSLYSLTFGLAFLDADMDGWQDAFIANGHIDDYIERYDTHIKYAQPPLLYHNEGGARFTDISAQAGPAMALRLVARGCAVADYDRDGDPDIVVTENNGEVHLLRNTAPVNRGWLRVVLKGHAGARQPVGARVDLEVAGKTQSRWVRAGGNFLSQNESPVLFGLGSAKPEKLTVTWPDGTRREIPAPAPNSEVVIRAE